MGSGQRGAGQVSHKFKLATHFRTVCTAPQLHLSTSRTTAESQFFGLLNAPLKVFLFYYFCLLLRFSAFFFLSFCFLLSFFISLFFSCILFLLRVILCSSWLELLFHSFYSGLHTLRFFNFLVSGQTIYKLYLSCFSIWPESLESRCECECVCESECTWDCLWVVGCGCGWVGSAAGCEWGCCVSVSMFVFGILLLLLLPPFKVHSGLSAFA